MFSKLNNQLENIRQIATMLKPQKVVGSDPSCLTITPDMSRLSELNEMNRDETLMFLTLRPVHTVVMTSFIEDNGMESYLNRGRFYGYRNSFGDLEGVALIGHATLVEARSEDAVKAFAYAAKYSEAPIHLIMSNGQDAESFWKYYAESNAIPRLVCNEALFELGFPFPVRNCRFDVRLATAEELEQIADAQAEIALMESGVDPRERDLRGFLDRVLRRIEQGRIFVVVEDGRLVFKADVIAVSQQTAYVEGIYVSPERRGEGIGPECLSNISLRLLDSIQNICLLSNVDFHSAHRSLQKAGFKNTGNCVTLFV